VCLPERRTRAAGGHQFLTLEDIKAFQQAIKELRGEMSKKVELAPNDF
jgi:hypothetical protein